MRPRFWPRPADQAITLTLCRRSRKRGSAVVSRWGVVASLVVAVGAAFGCLFAAQSEAGSPPARVVAVVPSPTGLRLRQLDAQTLAPVRGGWSRAVGVGTAMAVSPTGALVAVDGDRRQGAAPAGEYRKSCPDPAKRWPPGGGRLLARRRQDRRPVGRR